MLRFFPPPPLDCLHPESLCEYLQLLSRAPYKVFWIAHWLHWWELPIASAVCCRTHHFTAVRRTGVCSSGPRKRIPAPFHRTFTASPVLMTRPAALKAKCPITEAISGLRESSGSRKHFCWALLPWPKRFYCSFFEAGTTAKERAPPSDQKGIWTNLFFISSFGK